MNSSKKELIAGGVIGIVFACSLMEMFSSIITIQPEFPIGISGNTAIILGILITLYSIGLVLVGAWGISKKSAHFEKLTNRYSFKASFPGYFFYALVPIISGIALFELTKQANWGLWVGCLSFPTILIYLALALRKKCTL